MATITQNNIDFTNVQPSNIYAAGGKFSLSANDDGTGKFDTTLTGDEISKSLNAVEIDWNGAELGNKLDPSSLTPGETIIIETTGQLLSYISTIADKITKLENILLNL